MSACTHINRIPVVAKGEHIGSVSMGRCGRECLPGMVVCERHATRDALVYAVQLYAVQLYASERDEARAKLEAMR